MPSVLEFLSDHPLTPDRVADITRLIQEEHPPNTNVAPRDERLREIRSRLRKRARPSGQ